MRKLIFITSFIVANLFALNLSSQTDSIPTVFIVGEHEDQYQDLFKSHEAMLLTVCENDMVMAYEKWMSMLGEMEAYSDQIGYDLKGIKVWLNVFWDQTGKINHITYYPKPISRNTDFNELTAFFKSFLNNYEFKLEHDQNFSHFGQVSFPTTYKIIHNTKK